MERGEEEGFGKGFSQACSKGGYIFFPCCHCDPHDLLITNLTCAIENLEDDERRLEHTGWRQWGRRFYCQLGDQSRLRRKMNDPPRVQNKPRLKMDSAVSVMMRPMWEKC